MKLGSSGKLSVRTLGALFGAGSLFAASGCEPVNGILAVAGNTVQNALLDTAQSTVEDAVSGFWGNVIPGLGGS